jgi:glycosyltransferase involved in cell wall biosynthesis
VTRVAFDLRWVRGEKIDGIGRYSLSLAKALTKENLEMIYLYHKSKLQPLLKKELGVKAKLVWVPYDILSVKDLLGLPGFLKDLQIDIFFSPHYATSPFHNGYQVIVMVHDLIPFLYGKYLAGASLKLRLFYSTPIFARLVLQQAAAVVANSQATKKDVIRKFGLKDNKVTVLYPGVEFIKKVKLARPRHILYLGRMEPYKNLENLLSAYKILPSSLRDKFPLVIAGGQKEPYYSRLTYLAEDLGIIRQVRFLGFVKEEDLPQLYSEAAVFVYPSLYEGFGLPVLEARAAGVPVVTSNVSSLPEAGGKGAVFVDPKSTREIAEAVKRVLTDRSLRRKLSSGNKSLAKEFSWQRSAQKFVEIVNETTS